MTLMYISAHRADYIAASCGESNPEEIEIFFFMLEPNLAFAQVGWVSSDSALLGAIFIFLLGPVVLGFLVNDFMHFLFFFDDKNGIEKSRNYSIGLLIIPIIWLMKLNRDPSRLLEEANYISAFGFALYILGVIISAIIIKKKN